MLATFHLDAQDLSARLALISSEIPNPPRLFRRRRRTRDIEYSNRSPTLSPPPRADSEPTEEYDDEIRCYHELVQDSGRPACSPETLAQIRTHPENFKPILSPWQPSPFANLILPKEDDIKLFSEQLARWKKFRSWQYKSRGLATPPDSQHPSPDDSFDNPDYNIQHNENLSEDASESFSAQYCMHSRIMHNKYEAAQLENRSRGLAGYKQMALRRIEKYGLQSAPSLHDNPRQQNEKDTWIEYLVFETWWLDVYTSEFQKLDAPLLQHPEMQQNNPNPTSSETTAITMKPTTTIKKDDDSQRTAASESDDKHSIEPHDEANESLGDGGLTSVPIPATNINTNDVDYNMYTKTLHNHIKYERDRSQCLVEWVLRELRNVEAELRASHATEQTMSEVKKRKRDDETAEETLPESNLSHQSLFRSPSPPHSFDDRDIIDPTKRRKLKGSDDG